MQAYQQKTEKFFASKEKKFGRIDSWSSLCIKFTTISDFDFTLQICNWRRKSFIHSISFMTSSQWQFMTSLVGKILWHVPSAFDNGDLHLKHHSRWIHFKHSKKLQLNLDLYEHFIIYRPTLFVLAGVRYTLFYLG